ncbi:MAG: serine hydrolase [Planctomycetales bacterium]|nr:serine hydrolase [Planctomycetales bacterium]
MIQTNHTVVLVIVCFGVSVINLATAQPTKSDQPSVFPAAQWERKTPMDVGLSQQAVQEFEAIVGGRGCIVCDGYMVHTWGEFDQPHDVASAVKPFYSYLLMKAIEEKKLFNTEQRVVSFWPELQNKIPASHADRMLTLRHLAFQTACLGYQESPGQAFDYNDATMGFFWDTLINRIYKVPWDQAEEKVIQPLLGQPLGFQDGTPRVNGSKPGRFAVSTRDFCRFGWMMLNEGKWQDQQVLSAKFARQLVSEPLPLKLPRTTAEPSETYFPVRSIGGGGNQCFHNGGYSWLWWLNHPCEDGTRWFPDVDPGLFACFGHGGQEGMAVLPGSRVIVSWVGKELHQDRERGNRAFRLLQPGKTGRP